MNWQLTYWLIRTHWHFYCYRSSSFCWGGWVKIGLGQWFCALFSTSAKLNVFFILDVSREKALLKYFLRTTIPDPVELHYRDPRCACVHVLLFNGSFRKKKKKYLTIKWNNHHHHHHQYIYYWESNAVGACFLRKVSS